jgi:hypothetical protein
MIIYRFRPDMAYDCEVEVPDGTKAIPRFHTFQAPPEREGHYAVMRGGWILVEGEKPVYPPPVDPEQEKLQFNEAQKRFRLAAYRDEADPMYFKVQRNEELEEVWLAKIQEIKDRFPYQ